MRKQEILLSVLLSIVGLIVWLGVSKVSNEVEAWDSIYYFVIGLPIMFTASAIAGFIAPERYLRWGIYVVILQPVILFIQGEKGPLIIIGLYTFLVLVGFASGFAYLGGMLRSYTMRNK